MVRVIDVQRGVKSKAAACTRLRACTQARGTRRVIARIHYKRERTVCANIFARSRCRSKITRRFRWRAVPPATRKNGVENTSPISARIALKWMASSRRHLIFKDRRAGNAINAYRFRVLIPSLARCDACREYKK